MNYIFPTIIGMDDFVPMLRDSTAYRMVEKDGYIVFNYNNLNPNNFPEVTEHHHAFIRECRGIAFDAKTRLLVSRPFHKFFNYGERPETEDVNFTGSTLQDKRDGSMIHALFLERGTRLATRAGITDISMMAETFIADKANYQGFIDLCKESGFTPIFEYTSPNNKIVLNYKEEELQLLAVRHILTGLYMDQDTFERAAKSFDIPYCRMIDWDTEEADVIMSNLEAAEDAEGVVITLPDGHKVKMKCEWYVKLHKYVDMFKTDRHFVQTILSETFDDIKAYASPEVKERIKRGTDRLQQSVFEFATYLTHQAALIKKEHGEDKKAIALKVIGTYAKPIQHLMFKTIQSENPLVEAEGFIYEFIRKNSGKDVNWTENVLKCVSIPNNWLTEE